MGILRKLLLATLSMAWCLSGSVAHADKRVALIIGNSAYENIGRLANPRNDAKLMADTLGSIGFSLIGGRAQLDLDKAAFDAAVQDFGRQLAGAEVALFYYAGHGIQVRGTNYMIPVGANTAREADVDFQLVDVSVVLRQMEGSGTRLNMVVLDACRNNPFGSRGLRAVSAGLAQMRAPEGTLISYATQPGNVALDGSKGNSPYTDALVRTIKRPGLDIFQTFNEVGLAVKRATGGEQQPWVSSSPIDGNFYFVNAPASGAASPAPVKSTASEAAEAWSIAKDTTNPVVLESFIQRYGNTFFADLARLRIEELKAKSAKLAPQIAAVSPTQVEPTAPALATSRPQRVVLYDEDPSNPKGRPFVGTVVWRANPVKSAGRPDDIEVLGDVDIPDRKLKMTMGLRRNTDSSLPASHVIDLKFRLPGNFTGGGVSHVPGLLMKSNEQARGTPLSALAVKVTEGVFLVGLSNVESERARNVTLLTEREWFDIPVVYSNQKRGIIAIEKGTSGNQAFQTAFAAWSNPAKQPSGRLLATLGPVSYSVEVGSERTESEARSSYRTLQERFPNVLGGKTPIIQREDRGSSGVSFRVTVGSFPTEQGAMQFCADMKAAGGICAVRQDVSIGGTIR
jgi:hypothetical protein